MALENIYLKKSLFFANQNENYFSQSISLNVLDDIDLRFEMF